MIAAMLSEIGHRASYVGRHIETLYFGGGTPSLLTQKDLEQIWGTLAIHFDLSGLKECTFEANPDDISPEYLKMLGRTGINRLSMGIQSFRESDLRFMNRAHTAGEAAQAVKMAQDAGFDDITIDLIYGTPGLSDRYWAENLQKAIDLGIGHISSYALTVEEKTRLAHDIEKGKVAAPMSEQAARQFEIMVDLLSDAGFEHYEISNFAKKGQYALHNTNYWKGVHYLGIGPSAHSFDGKSRQWNVANNTLYIKGQQEDKPVFEMETLSLEDRMNEYLLTSLRTMWGLDLHWFSAQFGQKNTDQLLANVQQIVPEHILVSEQNIVLSKAGKLFADGIAASLFF